MSVEPGWDRTHQALADRDRLLALQRSCLTSAPDEAFERFARLTRDLLGVPVALVSLVTDDRQFFPGQAGLPAPWSEKRETPLSHSFCRHVVVDGIPKVFPDARIYAQVRDNLAIGDLGVVAYAGFPLTDADGRTLGSLCAIDGKPRAWTGEQLATLADLAAACSSELRLRIARETADQDRQRVAEAGAQLAMLAELTETLAGTLDMDDALRRLAGAVTPRLADWCLISLVDDAGRLRQVASAHADPSLRKDVAEFADLMITSLSAGSIVLSVLRTGEPVRGAAAEPSDMRARVTEPRMAEIAARLGYASHLTAPVTAPVSGRILGTISLVNGRERAGFTDADVRTAVDIGRRAGLALDNSRLYAEQRHVAEVLQRSMLTELPRIAHLELHARYLPAQAGAAVGGDWYDAFAQPDGTALLAVGDVSGHDIEAAATMGQLRNLIRGDAYGRDDAPAALLSGVDRAIRGLGVPAAATMVLAKVRPDGDGHTVTWSNAGHPPPLLLLPDGTAQPWWTPPEPLLGLAPDVPRHDHQRYVPAGATLLLYTDGLVEDPTEVLDIGIDRLRDRLVEHARLPAEELCNRLVEAVTRRSDDIALLLIRF
jgi:serine phosphatase RsbU (regulator of sigma subunit)